MIYYGMLFGLLFLQAAELYASQVQEIGMLQNIEYQLWNNQKGNYSNQNLQSIQKVENKDEPDIISCQTRLVNGCLICLASTPCFLYIASCFID